MMIPCVTIVEELGNTRTTLHYHGIYLLLVFSVSSHHALLSAKCSNTKHVNILIPIREVHNKLKINITFSHVY